MLLYSVIMRIAFVSDTAAPWHVGGVESTERAEAEELAKHHEVHFYSFRWKGMKEEFVDSGIHYHTRHYITENSIWHDERRRSIRQAVRFAYATLDIFSRKVDVVQASAFPFLHLPVVWLYCKLNGSKFIIDVPEVWDLDYWRGYIGYLFGTIANIISNLTLRLADLYISNPGNVYEKLIGIGIKRSKVHAFSPIIDSSAVSKIKAKKSKCLVVSVGRFADYKRFDSVLYAIKNASGMCPDVRCILVGEGHEERRLRKIINELGLGASVSIRKRYRDKLKLYSLIKSSSLMLNMSEREGLSATVLESLALGTPVLLPSYSPIPDVVKEMCIVCDVDDIPSMIASICRSKSKSGFLKKRKNLEIFSTSGIERFYNRVFRQLGLSK